MKKLSISLIDETQVNFELTEKAEDLFLDTVPKIVQTKLDEVNFFDSKFQKLWVCVTFFYDNMYNISTPYKIKITKIDKFNCLNGYVFINLYIIVIAQKFSVSCLKDIIQILLLETAIKAGERRQYNVPKEAMDYLYERRSKLGQIPEWIPEMETNPQLVIDLYKASVPKPK